MIEILKRLNLVVALIIGIFTTRHFIKRYGFNSFKGSYGAIALGILAGGIWAEVVGWIVDGSL